MYQNKKWFTDVVRTMNQINQIDKLESKQCKHECKCNKDFMTTLKSLYDKVDSDCYDMEMLADFIIDCEEMLKKPKLMVKFSINDEEFLIKGDTYKEIVNIISKMIIPKVYPMLYSIEWTDKDYHYIKSNDIKVIYNMLSNLD